MTRPAFTEEFVIEHQKRVARGRSNADCSRSLVGRADFRDARRGEHPSGGSGAIPAPLSFPLAMPPTTNLAYVVIDGIRRLSYAGIKYKKFAIEEVQKHALINRWRYPEGAKISLTIRLIMPQKHADVSNRVKLLEDSVAKALGFDDSAVSLLVVERLGIDKENPGCQVIVGIYGN